MDERFQKNKHWLGLGVLAIIFLSVGLCAFGAMASLMFRSGPGYGPAPYVQAPASEEGAPSVDGVAPPQTYYHGHGPLGMGRGGHGGPFSLLFGAVGFLFKLAFWGLLLLLLLGLVKRIFWGPGCCAPPRPGKPWKGKPGKHKHHAWGPPWTWHGYGPLWEQEAEPAGEAEASEAADSTDSQSEYTGPQE